MKLLTFANNMSPPNADAKRIGIKKLFNPGLHQIIFKNSTTTFLEGGLEATGRASLAL